MKWMILTLILCFSLLFTACSTIPRSIPNELSGKTTMLSATNWGYPRKGRELENLVETTRFRWLRVDFTWSKLEKEQGEWDFSQTDYFVDWCEERNIRIIGVLAFDTPWIHENPEGKREVTPDQLKYYLNFVEEVSKRYKGRVQELEIWNEPNMVQGRFWSGSKEDFFQLTKESIQRIHQSDPDSFVVAASLWRFAPSYLRKMFRSGALDQADAISFHPYYVSPRRTYLASRRFINFCRNRGFEGQFRVTEVGYPTGGSYITKTDPEEQASELLKTYFLLDQLDIPYAVWYCLYNIPPINPENSEDQFGLFLLNKENPDFFNYKTGGWAFQRWGELLNHTIAAPERVDIDLGRNWTVGAYRESEDPDVLRLLIIRKRGRASLVLDHFEEGRIWVTDSGDSRSLEPGETLTVEANSPLMLELWGLKDQKISLRKAPLKN